MNLADMQQLTVTIADAFSIDPALVCAVCHHESNWDPWAVRYEPAFYSRYISSMKLLTESEKQMRACSFGLMQVLGQVARELGFSGMYLTELCDPPKGIYTGCQKLARCLKDKNGNCTDALLAYNGGTNLAYPGLVLQFVDIYKAHA